MRLVLHRASERFRPRDGKWIRTTLSEVMGLSGSQSVPSLIPTDHKADGVLDHAYFGPSPEDAEAGTTGDTHLDRAYGLNLSPVVPVSASISPSNDFMQWHHALESVTLNSRSILDVSRFGVNRRKFQKSFRDSKSMNALKSGFLIVEKPFSDQIPPPNP